MSRFDIKITALDVTDAKNNKQSASGTCDGKPFTASPFNWGGRWLLKVHDDTRAQFGQGEKVAIGGACKKALREAGYPCPETKSHGGSTNTDKPVILVNGQPIAPVVQVEEPVVEAAAPPEGATEEVTNTAEEATGEVAEVQPATGEDVPAETVEEPVEVHAETVVEEPEAPVAEEPVQVEKKKGRRS